MYFLSALAGTWRLVWKSLVCTAHQLSELDRRAVNEDPSVPALVKGLCGAHPPSLHGAGDKWAGVEDDAEHGRVRGGELAHEDKGAMGRHIPDGRVQALYW